MLIPFLFVAAVTLSRQQDASTAVFTEPYAGIQFNYPKTWTVVKSKKRKDQDRTTLEIPIEGSTAKAELSVERTTFHASTDLWDTIQLRANEQLHRSVTRQWNQEILGVSMLFSKIEYTDHGTPMTAVVGLFYTKTVEKLLLRMTCPSDSFDNVNIEFKKLLETLRRTDGKMPEEDNPNITLDESEKKPEPAPIRPHTLENTQKAVKQIAKAPVAILTTVSTRKVVIRVPEGWTPQDAKDNQFTLKSTELSQPIHIQVFSTLDSDTPANALIKLCAQDLNSFSKVASRKDSNPEANKAGCIVSTVWRIGKTQSGDVATCTILGSMGEYYFLGTYRQPDISSVKAQQKLIESLLKMVSIEPQS